MPSSPATSMTLAATALAVLSLGGCATGGARLSSADRVRHELADDGLDPRTIAVPFEPSEEMILWARENVPLLGRPNERLQALLSALLHRDGTDLAYERGSTATAQEVWRTRRANCLSFTHLFLGLARALDLEVYYLRVSDLGTYERQGDLAVASEHVVAAYGPPSRRSILDFSDRPVLEYRSVQVISDRTAIALHYANLGANLLRQNRNDEALANLELATRIDPDLVDGWVNFGVGLRRVGRLAEAERCFRFALEVDPRAVIAYNNLASLLGRLGRHDEAAKLLALTDRADNRNPFSYLALGDLALAEGRHDEAERLYRRALRLQPDSPGPMAALGLVALAAGERHEAERWLRRARRAAGEEPRVESLARALGAPAPHDG